MEITDSSGGSVGLAEPKTANHSQFNQPGQEQLLAIASTITSTSYITSLVLAAFGHGQYFY